MRTTPSPTPPVSTAATLASAVAARAPADGVDRFGLLPDALLRDVVSRLPAARTVARARHALARPRRRRPRPPGLGPGRPHDSRRRRLPVFGRRRSGVPLRCVHLTRCHMASHQADVERWLELLAAKGVQLPRARLFQPPVADRPCSPTRALRVRLRHAPAPRDVHGPQHRRAPAHHMLPLYLRELVLDTFVIEEPDLHFLIDRSPVLEVLTITTNQTGAPIRLISRSLRCVQVTTSAEVHITVVDAPRLERLLMWMIMTSPAAPGERCSRIKIGHAPKLCMLGPWQLEFELEIGNTILKVGTKMSPSTMVPTVKILALEVGFEVHDEVKMMPCFLKCFPNVETLHVFSVNADPSGKVDPKLWKGKEAGCIDCVQRHVKKFVFQEFRGKRSELAFLKFIAETAQVLEKMVVMVASKCFSSADAVNAKLKPLTSAT